MVCMLWVVGLAMVIMDGTQEAVGDVDGAEGGDLEVARLLFTEFEVGGGEGLEALVLRASIPAAQSSKVSLIGPFLTRVGSVLGEHFVGISCPMWGMISVIISG